MYLYLLRREQRWIRKWFTRQRSYRRTTPALKLEEYSRDSGHLRIPCSPSVSAQDCQENGLRTQDQVKAEKESFESDCVPLHHISKLSLPSVFEAVQTMMLNSQPCTFFTPRIQPEEARRPMSNCRQTTFGDPQCHQSRTPHTELLAQILFDMAPSPNSFGEWTLPSAASAYLSALVPPDNDFNAASPRPCPPPNVLDDSHDDNKQRCPPPLVSRQVRYSDLIELTRRRREKCILRTSSQGSPSDERHQEK